MPEAPGRFSASRKGGSYNRPRPNAYISQEMIDAAEANRKPVVVAGQRKCVAERVEFERVHYPFEDPANLQLVADENGNLLFADTRRPTGLCIVRLRTVRV
jgi:hypothetical protein